MRITITRPTLGGGRYTAEELRDPLFADVRLEGAPEEVVRAGACMPLTLHYREVSSGVLDVLVQCPPAVLAQWARFYRQHILQGAKWQDFYDWLGLEKPSEGLAAEPVLLGGEWLPLPGQECDCHLGWMRRRCRAGWVRVQKDQRTPG
jgi:hypothetical protein